MSNLVIVKRVEFGTPEFIFLRYKIDVLVKERKVLCKNYESNALTISWISNTLRAMASLVYFAYKPKIKNAEPEIVPDARPWKKRGKKKNSQHYFKNERSTRGNSEENSHSTKKAY